MNFDLSSMRGSALGVLGVVAMSLALQGCIDSTRDKPAVATCSDLSATAVTFKGGNTLGEELTVSLDPATLTYTITIDASLQRPAGTVRSGALTPLEECAYASEESGAVFTLAPGGVVLGGIAAPTGTAFAPLVAFRDTWENAATPDVFNPVAAIYNLIGVHSDGTTQKSYGGSGRLRNAGTYQLCRDTASGGFMIYAAGCGTTVRGYITYQASRNAFDLYITPGTTAVTTGGTLSGSMILGLVGGTTVPLHLVRESATSYGLRLYTPQEALAAPAADGSYTLVDSDGGNDVATINGADYSRGTATATLSYDQPVIGVIQASGAVEGHLLSNAGILGFIPAGTGPAFELGVLN